MGTFKPGSAATMPGNGPGMNAAPPSFNSFNTPPPPPSSFAPTSPNSVLGPVDGPQKLDLSSISDVPPAPAKAVASSKSSADVRPTKMYNLDKSGPSPSASSSKKSSTLTKLASAAGSSKPASNAAASKSSDSAVKRLSSVAASKSEEVAAPAPAPVAVPAAPVNELPAPSPAPVAAPPVPPAATATATEESAVDTTLLAQPVRKGASDSNDEKPKESKGPQSRALPEFKFFQGKDKATIYPVSNPVNTRPIELIQFS